MKMLNNLKITFRCYNVTNCYQNSFRCASTHRVVGTFGETTKILPGDKKYIVLPPNSSNSSESKPLVVLFGWAGASAKNLSKYGDVYRNYGCPTIEFILPTRFIFR